MNNLIQWRHPDNLRTERYERWLKEIEVAAERLGSQRNWSANTEQLRKRIQVDGESLSSILPEAFAAVREVGAQTLNMRHYDEQLVGGMLLHDGFALEMETGEGKTLVATLPAYLQSLGGGQTLIVTVNDYLARRDMAWMGPIYHALGLSVGLVTSYHFADRQLRKYSYDADVVYVAGDQLASDYLQDQMVFQPTEICLRKLPFALIDEVDLILLDYATKPFVVPGESSEWYFDWQEVHSIVKGAREHADYHFEFDSVVLEDSLFDRLRKRSQELAPAGGNDALATLIHQVRQLLRASRLAQNDAYLVHGGKIMPIDPATGRPSPGGRFPDGLHEALETLHGIKPGRSSVTSATISYQVLFKKFAKLAGMSATVHDARDELYRMYDLPSAGIQPHRELRRDLHDDQLYANRADKLDAVTNLIAQLHASRAPVLVGGPSAVENADLAARIVAAGVPDEDLAVLDAGNVAHESAIVGEAGTPARITIATNMAGRGTDIVLGGDSRVILERMAHVEGEIAVDQAAAIRAKCRQGRKEVVAVGGLQVVLLQRQRNARADKHFMGRCARQGDPGRVYPFACLDDELFQVQPQFEFDPSMRLNGAALSRYREYVHQRQATNEHKDYERRSLVWIRDSALSEARDQLYTLRSEILHLSIKWEAVAWAAPIRAAKLDMGHAFDAEDGPSFPESWLARGILNSLNAEDDPRLYGVDKLEAIVAQAFGKAVGERYRAGQDEDTTIAFKAAAADCVVTEIRANLKGFDGNVAAEFIRIVALDGIDTVWKRLLKEHANVGEAIWVRAQIGAHNVFREIQQEQMKNFKLGLDRMQSNFVQLLVNGVPVIKKSAA